MQTAICKMYRFAGLVGLALLYVNCQSLKTEEIAEAEREIPQQIDYNFHVKPILSDRCFKCHGPDQNQLKGDLRLDIESEAFKSATNEASEAASIISPGHVGNSELALRICSDDPNYVMPPPESHLDLSAREKAILLRWIEQGAEYKPHWSFVPPQILEVPPVKNQEWANNDVDKYILKELEDRGLEGVVKANKETLLRRATLDLTGLPPTIAEIDAFLADDTPGAYQKVVDRLLDSPHYGERMALDWLDIARYADSHGYQDDGLRNTWPWRDWVIDAYNKNIRYDTFLLWQLAGDLLPDPSQEQLLATCFNRNHPQTQEGGVIDEEYRVEYVADRTNTVGKGLLGLTMECARCHDHKYDPITQDDYYSMYAYFNNNNDAGIVPYDGEASPTLILADDQTQELLDSLKEESGLLEAALQPENYVAAFRKWAEDEDAEEAITRAAKDKLMADFGFETEKKVVKSRINLDRKSPKGKAKGDTYAYLNRAKSILDGQVWRHNDDRPKIIEGKIGNGVQFVGDAGIRFNRDLDFDRHQPFSVMIWVKILKEGEAGPIFGKTNGDFEGYRGWLCKINEDGTLSFQLNHVWPDNSIDFRTLESVPIDEWIHIALTYDGSSKASGVNFYLNGDKPSHRLYTDNLNKSILHGSNGSNWSNQPFLLGMELRKSIKDVVMDELKIYQRELAAIEIEHYLSGGQNQIKDGDLLQFYLVSGQNRSYQSQFDKLTELRDKENLILTDLPEVMIMRERKYAEPTYVLDRGAYDAPTKEVNPRVPSFMDSSYTYSADRLGFAQWLINPKNPLTARVAVNRLWSTCFGHGLVATQEDFGSQGNMPSHPELLDWLALRFIDLDWDVKAMLKEIMMSATYQQSSVIDESHKELDPLNELYSRYPATRLSAEAIRDQALAGSGLLVKTIGGPSVYPYQPAGIWKALATRNATEYRQQTGDSLYRRSLYTVWKRSSPPPAMLNFDAPDRYYCVVRRQNTSTPLQSLVLMNDPQFVEAARVLAELMMKSATEDHGITLAFQRLLGRSPRIEEMESMQELYQVSREAYRSAPSDAEQLLSVGESPLDGSLDPIDLAAHTMLASTVINFDEFVMKR